VTGRPGSDDLFGAPSGAEFSANRRYRYDRWRHGSSDPGDGLFIGLNPSTADEHDDDATIKRCRDFTARFGYGRFHMANLFALCTKSPRILRASPDPMGDDNDQYLRKLANKASVIVCAWGDHGRHQGRDIEVIKRLNDYPRQCLAINQTGTPKHPLYFQGDTPLKPYPLPDTGQAGAKFGTQSGAIYGGDSPKQAFSVNLLHPVPVTLMTSRGQARLR